MTPLQRTLAHLRAQGYMVDVTERFIPAKAGGFRKDLFGIFDGIAVPVVVQAGVVAGVIGFQATTMAHFADRREKIQRAAVLPTWKAAGNRVLLYGWAKKGPRGKRKTWAPTVEEV